MLLTVAALFEHLNDRGIRYCHWKSNWILEETLAGKTDIDLLVHREDAPGLRTILQELGFRPAIEAGVPPFPSVEHYHALDAAGSTLVHVHAYYRVISGDSLAKNYRLPLEEMLLADVTRAGVVNVPTKGAELIVFLLRMYLKHATLAELVLVIRGWDNVRRELAWLATDTARAEAASLLSIWLPSVDQRLFNRALDGLLNPAPLWRRVVIARSIRAQLRQFARRGRAGAWFAGLRAVASRGVYRLRGSRKGLAPAGGGAVIAFVGPEATGKSTMIEEMERWLGRHFAVERVHAGKPPSTWLTLLPNLLLPTFRFLLPAQRSTVVSAQQAAGGERRSSSKPFPLLFGVRSVFLAHDRRALLTRAFANAANGRIVLSDRYPIADSSAPDGAQLGPAEAATSRSRLRLWLAHVEARLYREIPRPDLAIYLTAPLEITLERNRLRTKTEPEDYVRWRHVRASNLEFGTVRVRKIDTARPVEEAIREVKQAIWEVL